MALDSYQEYAHHAIENYSSRKAADKYLLFDAVKDLQIEGVLDIGCGAGQELVPFVEKTNAVCVGIDRATELGAITREFFKRFDFRNRVAFARSDGANLPFADASFDVVLCRVALPYMHNQKTIAEVARVLKPNGVFLLKTHAPAFYFGMILERLKTFSLRQIAYPVICLSGGAWHSFTGRQLQKGFWAGKEVYQTKKFLRREFAKNNLRIEGQLSDTNIETPSFVVVKNKS
jgi:ubiquinone/menaquinone biosynthesis C-methylase UbiE